MHLLRQLFFIFLQIIGVVLEETTTLENYESNETDIVFRVINGKRANLGEVPYQVGFRAPFGSSVYLTFCGGTIIKPNKILSAAHCFESTFPRSQCCNSGKVTGKKVSKYYAVAGSLYNAGIFTSVDSEYYGQWRQVKTVFYHTKYDFPQFDIAVVKINKPFTFNEIVNKIPVATVWEEYKGNCLVSGYGRTATSEASPYLLLADLEILATKRCNKFYGMNTAKFVCTSDEISNVDQGDSGGPLVCKNTKNKNEAQNGILVGIVAGKKLEPGGGGLFTRVASYREFIASKVCIHTIKLPFLVLCLLCSINIELLWLV